MEMDDIQNKLDLLKGKICWGVLSGEPNASIIFLHIGEKIKREKNINNNNLPYNIDKYKGEYVIEICCSWRLQNGGKPITSSSEPNFKNGPLVKGLQKIVDNKILSIEITDDCGDLSIILDNYWLKIFCDNTGNDDPDYYFQEDLNWEIRFKNDDFISVKKGCEIII
jgi:hypothetical protein